MKRCSFVLLLLFLALVLPAAPSESDALSHPLHAGDATFSFIASHFSGELDFVSPFTQIKRMHNVSRALKSEGTMYLSSTEGIVWIITKPFPSELVIGKSAIIQRLPGRKEEVIDLGDNQIFTQISQAISLVFQGSPEALSASFEVYGQQEGASWLLVLIPKESAVRSFISRFVIAGSTLLESVMLCESSGDTTTYLFSEGEERKLTHEETAHFAF